MPLPTHAVSDRSNAEAGSTAVAIAARRFLDVLRRENEHLCAGDVAAAMSLFPEKHDTATVLHSVLRGSALPRTLADAVLAATAENVERLQAAMTVQSRILEIVARAARHQPAAYDGRGAATSPAGALALTIRA